MNDARIAKLTEDRIRIMAMIADPNCRESKVYLARRVETIDATIDRLNAGGNEIR